MNLKVVHRALEWALIGAGGHAREVMAQMGMTLPRFVEDEYYSATDQTDDLIKPLSSFDCSKYAVIVCIADPEQRRSLISRLPKETQYFTYIHPSAKVLSNTSIAIGEGSFIGANSILTCDLEIGKHAILNRGNQVSHDCKVGDYFSMMPGAMLSGNDQIGDCVYLGAGSIVRERVSICSNVTVGLNAGVVNDIIESGVYAGTPAKKIK